MVFRFKKSKRQEHKEKIAQKMDKKISIAIDGPAGAGKTTIARKLANILNYKYIDTGAMYRAAAWKSLQMKIPLSDEAAIIEMTANMNIDFEDGDGSKILVDGKDVSKDIRSSEVTQLSSPISAISGVRKLLVAKQKSLAGNGGVVMEGRDIGTVVMPDAEVKVFMIASIEERAKRRYKEVIESGQQADIDDIRKAIEERDFRDSNRSDSPLMRAEGAVDINTDTLTIDQVVSKIKCLCDQSMK